MLGKFHLKHTLSITKSVVIDFKCVLLGKYNVEYTSSVCEPRYYYTLICLETK